MTLSLSLSCLSIISLWAIAQNSFGNSSKIPIEIHRGNEELFTCIISGITWCTVGWFELVWMGLSWSVPGFESEVVFTFDVVRPLKSGARQRNAFSRSRATQMLVWSFHSSFSFVPAFSDSFPILFPSNLCVAFPSSQFYSSRLNLIRSVVFFPPKFYWSVTSLCACVVGFTRVRVHVRVCVCVCV